MRRNGVKALDPLTATATAKWDFKLAKAPWAGTLSTSGGVVFAGDEDGYLMALDARSGKTCRGLRPRK